MNRMGLLVASLAFLSACQPRTPAQKAEDKAEDVGHETKQGVERAGEKVEKAGDKVQEKTK